MIADLFSIRGTAPRLPEAACRGHAGVFDSHKPDETDAEAAYRYRIAVAICHQCNAANACLAWLHGLSPAQLPSGIVAGHVVDHRGQIKRLGGNAEAAS